MQMRAKARVVVLGGGYAGMMAAARVARHGNAQVTLVDQRQAFVQRIRLHEALAGTMLPGVAYAPVLGRRGATFVQAQVQGIDPQRQEVSIAVGRSERRLGYDVLIVALGSATTAGIPGVAEGALRLNDAATVARSSAELRALAERGGHCLIVGGGMTAIETASELAERLPTLRVTLATGGVAGADFSAAGRQHLQTGLARLGVQIREGSSVASLEPGQAWLASGEALAFDRCIWACGFAAPTLLAESGLPVDAQGRVWVTTTLQVCDNPTVFVAGDSAAAGDAGQTIRMGCVSAMPLGAHVGENVAALLAGAPQRPFRFGFVGRCVSLGRHDGLFQFTNRFDQPVNRLISGRAGAIVKELICQMTLASVHGELWSGLSLYQWPGGDGWWATPAAAA
jgi:NADH dehydrogenase FAD-containing subunit